MRYWNWSIKSFWIKRRNKILEISYQIILSSKIFILIKLWINCIRAQMLINRWLIHRQYKTSGINSTPRIKQTPKAIPSPPDLNPENQQAHRISNPPWVQNPIQTRTQTILYLSPITRPNLTKKNPHLPYPTAPTKNSNGKTKSKNRK